MAETKGSRNVMKRSGNRRALPLDVLANGIEGLQCLAALMQVNLERGNLTRATEHLVEGLPELLQYVRSSTRSAA